MSKEFHWHENGNSVYIMDGCLGYFETAAEILSANISAKEGKDVIIHSTQSCFITADMLAEGWQLFAHFDRGYSEDDEVVEIKLGNGNKNTDREIRMSHNLEKLLLAGEFGEILIAMNMKEE